MTVKLKFVLGCLLVLLIVAGARNAMLNADDDRENDGVEFTTQDLSKDELTALWERLKQEKAISWGTSDYLSHNETYVLHKGDLTIGRDDVFPNVTSLIVDGDVIIEGSYSDRGLRNLVVLGDMKATNILTMGTLVVTGRLNVSELVYCYYNDNISEFTGGVVSRAFFIYDKQCSFPSEESTIGYFVSDTVSDEPDITMYRNLRPEITAVSLENFDIVPDFSASERIIAAGESIFRAEPAGDDFADAWQRLYDESNGYAEFETSDLADIADVDEAFRIVIAKREDLDPQIQALLIKSGEQSVLTALARNWSTTSQHLAQISDLAPATRPIMASNPNAPASLIEALAADPDAEVRAAIAQRNDLNAALATKLAGDPEQEVRLEVAQGGGIHYLREAALATLAKDDDAQILQAVVNSDAPLPAETHETLAKHANADVRIAVAEALQRQTLWQSRRTLSQEARHRIAEGILSDKKELVSRSAAGALGADRQLTIGTEWLSKIAEDTRHHYWCMALAEVTTSPELMLKFADAENLRIREMLAKNLALTAEAQHRLLDPLEAAIKDGTEVSEELEEIASELAQNDNVADDVLMRLARFIEKAGTESGYSIAILHNDNTPPDVLTLLFALENDEDYREDVALHILHSPRAPKPLIGPALALWYDRDERGLVAEYKPLEILSGDAYWDGLANAKDERLRFITASNEAAPADLIVKLAADDEREVNREARNHPKLPEDHPLLLAMDVDDMADPRLSDAALMEIADRFRRRGERYNAGKLFAILSRRNLRAEHE